VLPREEDLDGLRVRLRKTKAVQTRLLDLLEKEVRGPLSATGTFFDLVEDNNKGTAFGLEVASRATRQFQQALNVLDVLLEWGAVRQLERKREWPVTDTHRLLRGLFAEFKQGPCARRFTLMDRHRDIDLRLLPEPEIGFVFKMLLFWLCEVAEEGEVSVERLAVEGNRFRVGLQLRSGSLFSRLGQKVERLVNGKLSSEGKNCPAEGFYLAMARDVLEEYDGDLWVRMEANGIDAGFELDIRG